MKVCLLIIISIVTTNFINNANSVGEHGQKSKLYKSFDEIFGKGWDDESNDSNELNCRHVKEEVQDVQAPNTSDQKNIDEILKQKFDEIDDENWSEDENNSAPDQDQSVDEQQNESNKCAKNESDQQKREIIQKFREMKENYREKNKRAHSAKEWVQIEKKISNGLGVGRSTIYKWKKELGLSQNKSKFSELEKRQILKQFDEIKSKCKKAKIKNDSKNELIAKKMGTCIASITLWKRAFGLSVSNKICDATKIGILKKYAKIKEKNPKMTDCEIADLLKISISSLKRWKIKFCEENNHL